MDIRKIKKIIDLVKKNNVAELELHEETESIRITITKTAEQIQLPHPVANQQVIQSQTVAELPSQEANLKQHTIDAPMVGTVYLSATPGANYFVEVGQQVAAGDTLCLIEAMKMFNRIEADRAGTIAARLVDNKQPVEYGQPLFVIK